MSSMTTPIKLGYFEDDRVRASAGFTTARAPPEADVRQRPAMCSARGG